MTDIKKTGWPAFIITLVMLFIGSFAIAAVAKKSGEEAGRQKSEQTQSNPADGKVNVIKLDQGKLETYSYTDIAANMLQRAINGEDVSKHMHILKNANADKLSGQLNTDEKRLSFWINVYNGYTQHFLKTDPTLYKNDRNAFFKKEQINIAGFNLAMNDIEHGALRRGATIWTKGHLRIPFRNEFVRTFKVDDVDYRIHFALNCGAKSCPPVNVFLADKTNAQLDKASDYYLNKETEYNKEANVVKVPALLKWFAADFGSKNDKRNILKKYDVIPMDADPAIEYKDYDWTMKVDNYKQF